MPNEQSLVLKVDATAVGQGSISLDELAAAGARAEASTEKFSAASRASAGSVDGAKSAMYTHAKVLGEVASGYDLASGEVRKLIEKYDPLGAKLRALDADFRSLNSAAKTGMAGSDYSAIDRAYASMNAEIAKTKGLLNDTSASGTRGLNELNHAAKETLFSTVQAKRELIVLFHEAATGNFSRMPGSFLVLIEYMDLTSKLFNVFNIAMAGVAVSVLGVIAAIVKGSIEQKEFNNALITTGNYSGLTSDSLNALAHTAVEAGGSIGHAKDAVLALAASGKYTATQIAVISDAAVAMELATGKSIEKTIKEFDTLAVESAGSSSRSADSISKASIKLNDTYHYLTLTIYEQIRAFEKDGDQKAAAALATETLANVTKTRAAEMIANLGYVSRAWIQVKESIGGAIDAVGDFGKKATPASEVARLTAEVNGLQPGNYGMSQAYNEASRVELLGVATRKLAAAQFDLDYANQEARKSSAEAVKQSEGVHAAARIGVMLSEAQRKSQSALTVALKEYREEIARVKEANPQSSLVTPDAIAAGEKALIKQHSPASSAKGSDDRASVLADLLTLEKTALDREREIYSSRLSMINLYHNKLGMSDSEFYEGRAAARQEYLQSLSESFLREQTIIADATVKTAKEAADKQKQLDKLTQSYLKARADVEKSSLEDTMNKMGDSKSSQDKMVQSELNSTRKETDAIRDKVRKLEEETEVIGMTDKAIKALTLTRMDSTISLQKMKIAAMQAMDDSKENLAVIQAEIDKLNELIKLRDATSQNQAKKEQSIKLEGFDLTSSQLTSLANTTDKMGDNFKNATKALQGFASAYKTLANADKDVKLSADERTAAQVDGYAQMAGAAKSFFKEGSDGYEALALIEQALYIAKFAMQAQEMLGNAAVAASSQAKVATELPGELTLLSVKGAQAVLNQGDGDPYSAFVRMAAMAAIVAAVIASAGGSSGAGVSGGGGAGSRGAGAGPGNNGTYAESGYVLTSNGRVGQRGPLDYESNENANRNPEYDTWLETERAADEAYKALRAANSGLTEFEQRLSDVKKAVQGTGRDIYDKATEGMSEAQRASYNYNASLTMQADVLVDIANETNNTSDTMRQLASESEKLAIELMEASGDIAGARYQQELIDTRGYSAEEIAVYKHNQAMRDQIAAANAGAAAAEAAAAAEQELARTRYELAGRLNILLGRQTQTQYDRATELAETTDAASISMLNWIYALEDINTALDTTMAVLERSIAKEKELATARLTSAKEVQALLQTTLNSVATAMSRADAQESLGALLSDAMVSKLVPPISELKPIMAALSKPSTDLFTNFVDYSRDAAYTANDISDMLAIATDSVSTEQQTIDLLDQQLANAKSQLDAIRGVDNSVKDVTSAVNDFSAVVQALAEAQASAPQFNYAMPMTSTGGGGGGYYGGGGGGGTPSFENIEGQDNIDIVSAYRAYFNRNPDPGGYIAQLNSGLSGDTLMKSILRGAQGGDFDTAISRGYDPKNPDAKYLRSILYPGGSSNGNQSGLPFYEGGLAVGTNEVPADMFTVVHAGEEITPQPYVDKQREARDLTNELMNRLVNSNENLRADVANLRAETRAVAKHSSQTASILDRLTAPSGGESLKVAS